MSDPYTPRRAYQQQPYDQPQPGYGYAPPNPDLPYYDGRHPGHRQPPRKRRRVFLWVFLAVQALFVIWIIAAAATVHTQPTTAQLAAACYHHQWWPVFKSQADCVTHYGGALRQAGDLGKGIGIAAVIALWAVTDIILGISYGVYRLATRSR